MLGHCEVMCLLSLQKNPNNLDILAFWLANTSRLLHDMKQYSGDRVSGQSTLLYVRVAPVKALSKLVAFACFVYLYIRLNTHAHHPRRYFGVTKTQVVLKQVTFEVLFSVIYEHRRSWFV